MVFSSIYYFLFLLITGVLFYAVPNGRWQQFVLIAASLVFVAIFNWISVIALLLIILGNYFLLRRLVEVNGVAQKRLFYSGIILNILLLLIYKFIQEVFSNSGNNIIQGFDNGKWILLGIGFYMLQIIGYYFDVYKSKVSISSNFYDFAFSLSFFAKLPSGPILTYPQSNELLPNKRVQFNEGNIAYGVQRILLGLFKKVALADRLLPYVSNVFDNHQYLNGLMIYLAPFLFTLQLYFDFSGYIDLGIGSARLFGIRLPENFNLPLRAQSIAEFWRRWHITLVNWLTKNIFYPLSFQYRKMKNKGLALAVFITFLVSGVWHGLALTYVVWAMCHFSYIVIENLLRRKGKMRSDRSLFQKLLSILLVWHLVALGNFFFRLHSIQDAGKLISDFLKLPFLFGNGLTLKTWLINGGQDIENEFNFRLTLFLCITFLLFEKRINEFAFSEKYRVAFGAALLVLLAVFGMFNTGQRFIYMQF